MRHGSRMCYGMMCQLVLWLSLISRHLSSMNCFTLRINIRLDVDLTQITGQPGLLD